MPWLPWVQHNTPLAAAWQGAIDTLLCVDRRTPRAARGAGGGGAGRDPVQIFCGTWNVNGKLCSEADLHAWFAHLGAGQTADGGARMAPDVYVVGFQARGLE